MRSLCGADIDTPCKELAAVSKAARWEHWWPDGPVRLSRAWRRGYERVRRLRERGALWSVALCVAAFLHKLATMLLGRVVFLCAHPILCLRHPLVFGRFSRRRIKRLLLKETGLLCLSETTEACRAVGMRPFLTFGTLLGHCREGGFLGHDRDVDLGCMAGDAWKVDALARAMAQRGWAVKRRSRALISFVKPFSRTVTVDIYFFHPGDDGMVCVHREATSTPSYTYVYPAEAFSHWRTETFGGCVEVLVPEQAERFLELTYGDWRTPREDWDYRLDPSNRRNAASV
jgi:hypothetical protein